MKASLEAVERQLTDVISERNEAMRMAKEKDKQVVDVETITMLLLRISVAIAASHISSSVSAPQIFEILSFV